MNLSLNPEKVLVLGASGQVGSCLKQLLPGAVVCDRQKADLSRPEQLVDVLNRYRPEVVINAAAYTAVDKAETENSLCEQINAHGPAALAKWCGSNQSMIIHYSTDYVFPGGGLEPWKESDPVDPLNFYGLSKLKGEELVKQYCPRHFILRTSWVYHTEGSNFVRTMLRLAKEKESLNIVDDQIGCPNWAQHLAKYTLKMIDMQLDEDRESRYGIYHFSSTGYCSWFEFAKRIFELAGAKEQLAIKSVQGVPSEQYPTPAKRPKNSRFDTSKLKREFDFELPTWTESLTQCLEEIYAN